MKQSDTTVLRYWAAWLAIDRKWKKEDFFWKNLCVRDEKGWTGSDSFQLFSVICHIYKGDNGEKMKNK